MNNERELYKKMWTTGYRRSQCSIPLISFIKKEYITGETALEIGSGDGTSLRGLIAEGVNVTGTDIYSTRSEIIECPAWELPFADNSFDLTFSTDVLEHLPTDMVQKSIVEILRVTNRKSIHIIACWEDVRDGEVLHKTVRKIYWWNDLFSILNKDKKELIIMDRDQFI